MIWRYDELLMNQNDPSWLSECAAENFLSHFSSALTDREGFIEAMKATHAIMKFTPACGSQPATLDIFFGGTMNNADLFQDAMTGIGLNGKAYKSLKTLAGEIVSLLKKDCFDLKTTGGHSLGGGIAQAFLARVESQVKLPRSPQCIVLDPQLLNNKQARSALKQATRPYSYTAPRGLIIDLDYPANPKRSLCDIMKTFGRYTHPGMVHLKLDLTEEDGAGGPPEKSGLPMMGYHGDNHQYRRAIERFSGFLSNLN
ncbi:MAG: hypothetical protein RIR70_1993 [Pseudomonadota bacterium]